MVETISGPETGRWSAALPGETSSPWQIWRQAVGLYWRNWPEFTAIAAVGYGLLLLGALVLGGAYYLFAPLAAALGPLLLAVGTVGGVVYVGLVHCVMLAAIAAYLLANKPISLSQTFGRVADLGKKLWIMLLLLLALIAIIVVGGGIPVAGWLIAPGVLFYLGVIGSLAPAVLVAEGLPGVWLVARVWGLTRLHFWRSLLVMGGPMLLGWLILALPTLAMLALNLPLQFTDIWLPLLLGLFYTPVYAAVAVLAYLDLRLRHAEAGLPAALPAPAGLYNPTGRAGLITLPELGKLALVSVGMAGLAALFAAGSYATVVVEPASRNELAARELIGLAAPEFSATSLDGGAISLAQLKGKPTVINFWATWCPPCKEELPALEQAYQRLGSRVNFVAISVNEDPATVSGYVQAEALDLPVALDPDSVVANQFLVRGLPTTVFLDANGVMVSRHLGGLAADTLADYLDSLLLAAE